MYIKALLRAQPHVSTGTNEAGAIVRAAAQEDAGAVALPANPDCMYHVTLTRVLIGVQLLEWWYTQAESKLGGTGALPTPPPPPVPRPHPDGIPLPEEPAVCPICQQARRVACAASYLFAIWCARHREPLLSDHGWCAVSKC